MVITLSVWYMALRATTRLKRTRKTVFRFRGRVTEAPPPPYESAPQQRRFVKFCAFSVGSPQTYSRPGGSSSWAASCASAPRRRRRPPRGPSACARSACGAPTDTPATRTGGTAPTRPGTRSSRQLQCGRGTYRYSGEGYVQMHRGEVVTEVRAAASGERYVQLQ